MAPQIKEASGEKPAYAELNNLISEKLGGRILFATDDWFTVAENLLKGEFTEFGKWMDGWETRRKRKPGHDWCIIKLGVAGVVEGVDVDTCHFTGNYVPRVSIQAAVLTPEEEKVIPERKSEMGTEASDQQLKEVEALNSQEWTTIIPRSQAGPGYPSTRHTYLPSESNGRYTHLRLNIYPDGGIARLRVFGYAVPDWSLVSPTQMLDLASVESGGVCLEYSDAHYGHPRNLIGPGRGVNMGDGWETARRLDRPPILVADGKGVLEVSGYEWTVLRLGHHGNILKVEVDTHHFKGNYPDSCRIDGCLLKQGQHPTNFGNDDSLWLTILSPQKMRAHDHHFFEAELEKVGPVSHVRVVIAPDGGISRVRIYGNITPTES
ncbi:Allantoicase-like [Homarus americanus]|uniref:Allantoate amidinohydrolase n=1 Tax=Homarus americanus TaxID=6706 RepID=A0A8J5N5E1_HOMAM|nr:Allantoicase-like [Homarus americanus]